MTLAIPELVPSFCWLSTESVKRPSSNNLAIIWNKELHEYDAFVTASESQVCKFLMSG